MKTKGAPGPLRIRSGIQDILIGPSVDCGVLWDCDHLTFPLLQSKFLHQLRFPCLCHCLTTVKHRPQWTGYLASWVWELAPLLFSESLCGKVLCHHHRLTNLIMMMLTEWRKRLHISMQRNDKFASVHRIIWQRQLATNVCVQACALTIMIDCGAEA